MKHFFLALTACLLISSGLIAQETDKSDEVSVEELYLSNPEVLIILTQAQTLDRETKLEALKGVEKMIEDGTITYEVEGILIALGSEGTTSKTYEGKTQLNNFPEVRRRACNLLGRVGGERATDALIQILYSETESMVMSEAAYALGVIGDDEEGSAVKALAFKIDAQTVTAPDSNFAYAVILALQKIAEKNNGLTDPSGYRTLIHIAQGNYIRGVKRMALETLRDMKSYSR